ncbi:LLM class flavin-dependent oxidoreductase [Azoarcus indigens]|uniref:Alkanesulfonate monooxygenase n=1 Tax=Azoarcus indigens TaxID=29545 RepID=A0A4R6EGI9_9RHOO|nr:LLM class flavin-dependent oxidoreductase [Azoarcus indigens]NMG63370.1 LLM class flavin-dependent oxidoreductase [Azoarcus indigens]TDN56923.1 alkanesulfonate monooxygenase [Azoarcus indigens]
MSRPHAVEFIGFLSHQEASEIQPASGPLVDKAYLGACARAQEHAGFDRALIAYHSAAPDGLQIAAHAAHETRRLGLLVAHRPGVVAPTVAARQFASLDHFSDGRAAINIVSGGNDAEQQRDGDFLGHDERYARTDEYLEVLKLAWTRSEPFDFDGRHYRVKGHVTQARPLQQPHIPIFFGGSSAAALEVAGKHADVFMMWGEPLAGIAEQIAAVRATAARHGRAEALRFSLSLRPILGATEDEAWARAERILDGVRGRLAAAKLAAKPAAAKSAGPQNEGSRRLLAYAERGEVLDSCLWTGITALTGAASGAAASTGIGGNSTALVGTPEQVADALLAYHRLGVSHFLVRGFEPLADAVAYGRELLPRVRARLAEPLPAEAFAAF